MALVDEIESQGRTTTKLGRLLAAHPGGCCDNHHDQTLEAEIAEAVRAGASASGVLKALRARYGAAAPTASDSVRDHLRRIGDR